MYIIHIYIYIYISTIRKSRQKCTESNVQLLFSLNFRRDKHVFHRVF